MIKNLNIYIYMCVFSFSLSLYNEWKENSNVSRDWNTRYNWLVQFAMYILDM